MGLAVQADKGYTALKMNYKNVEGGVTITQEGLNTCKTKTPARKILKLYARKSRVQIIFHILAFRSLLTL